MVSEKALHNIEKKLWDDIQTQEKRVDKLLSFVRKFNHKMLHLEEFIIVGVIAFCSIMLAHLTGLDEFDPQNRDIAMSLQAAINEIQPGVEQSRIISQRAVDSDVQNTFYKGYCTYGAALISPEFFPYVSPTEQERTRGGNAADRYLNAQLAGFPVGSEPREGALIIYKRGDRFVNAGHVGKVMAYFPEYGKMIVRDMNRVGRGIMSDRREYTDNDNILGFIYPKPGTVVEMPEWVDENATIEIDEKVTDSVAIVVFPEEEEEPIQAEMSTGPSREEVSVDPIVVEIPAVEPINPVEPVDYNVDLDLSGLPLDAQHFLSQRDVKITTKLHTLTPGEKGDIVISISNKKDGSKFSGILPIAFNIITSSSSVSLDYSTLQLVYDGEARIQATANKTGKTAILFNFGQKEIAKLILEVQ